MKNDNTLGSYLYQGLNIEYIEKIFVFLDYQLKQIHNKNRYVEDISFRTIILDEEEEYFSFKNEFIQKMPKECDRNVFIRNNINHLVKLFIGAFAFETTLEQTKNINIEWFDFPTISKRNPSYVEEHYNYLKTVIPNSEKYGEYYDDVILDNKYEYFNDYKRRQDEKESRTTSRQMTYSTPVGRALSEKEDIGKSAYAQILIYPIITACFMILIAIFYIIYILI